MGFYRGPRIVQSGLVLALDAGSERSYTQFPTTVEVLVVAGGGGGGADNAGGGGGGGLIYDSSYTISSELTVTIGAGGYDNTVTSAGNGGTPVAGGNSVFGTLTAIGGGCGKSAGSATVAANSGGSGGGGEGAEGQSAGGTGTANQGFAGGAGVAGGGGGGGGAGEVGQNGNVISQIGGDGGDGLQYNISGTPTYYAGGGGGGNNNSIYSPRSTGGLGGGGDGGSINSGTRTDDGTPNTGGGGGGMTHVGTVPPGTGGTGIVIVRYTGNPKASGGTMVTSGGYTTHTFTSSGTFGISTTWVDLSGDGNHGTLVNGPTYDTDNAGSIVFDGLTDHVSIAAPSSPVIFGTQLTEEVWIYPTDYATSGGARQYLMDPRGDGSTGGMSTYFLYDYISAPDTVDITVGNGGVEVSTPTFSMPLNRWHHIVATRNYTSWVVYLNGEIIHTETSVSTASLTLNNSFRIATYAGGTSGQYFFEGRMAIAKLYNKALTQAEITQNFNAQKGRFGL